MKKILVYTFLVSAICSQNLAAIAQSLPRLRKGMPYAQARSLLLRQGWRAVVNSEQVNNPNRSGVIDYFINRQGYTEVVDCSGTGIGLCLFQFRNRAGQTLMISTADNDPPGKSTVYGWRIETRSNR